MDGRPLPNWYVGVLFVVFGQQCMKFDKYHINLNAFKVCETMFSKEIFWWRLTIDTVYIAVYMRFGGLILV